MTHPEVVYPEFKLMSNPVKEVAAAGRCILQQSEQCPDLCPFFPWSVPDQDRSSSRKLKAKDGKRVSSISEQDVKGRAESVKGRDEGAAPTDGAEPAQGQVDSISLETYRQKFYIEVSLTKACIVVLVLLFSCKAH